MLPEPVRDQSGVRIYQGHAREILAAMPEESVQCVVTSPPYWGLRDYGTEGLVWGGEAGCEHEWGDALPRTGGAQKQGETSQRKGRSSIAAQEKKPKAGAFCRLCGAWRGSLGMEPTIELYVEHIVEVFREVRHVLRNDGTLWLNMGDCYAGSGLTGGKAPIRGTLIHRPQSRGSIPTGGTTKPKDLVGMPWRVALALQADGWYLRSDIIWAKPNPMPESIRDRPTKAHEYVFLFSKSKRYFFDQEAVREPQDTRGERHEGKSGYREGHLSKGGIKVRSLHPAGRNIRSVWTIPTQPFPEAHFATFPEELARRCIAAGTSERGCCPQCGAPWVRVVDKSRSFESGSGKSGRDPADKNGPGMQGGGETRDVRRGPVLTTQTIGWKPGCKCYGVSSEQTAWDAQMGLDEYEPIPCTVLDPFAGSGTTLLVAKKLGRRAVGIDLSLEYCEIASTRASGRGVMRRPRKRLRRRRVAR